MDSHDAVLSFIHLLRTYTIHTILFLILQKYPRRNDRAQTRSILHVAVYRIAHRITMNHRFSSSTIPIVIEYYIQKSIRTSLLFDSTQKQK